MKSENATKENRDVEFYRDAFTSMSTWGKGFFEAECAEHNIIPEEEERFGDTASRLWDALSEEDRNAFASNYDDWLDA